MTLVKLNQSNLMRDLAHSAFSGNFNDSNLDRFNRSDSTSEVDYHVNEEETLFKLEMAIPGLTKDDLRIEADNSLLTIETIELSEENKRSGFAAKQFTKRFKLSKTINQEAISAQVENGVLTMLLPKIEAAVKKPARMIEIA